MPAQEHREIIAAFLNESRTHLAELDNGLDKMAASIKEPQKITDDDLAALFQAVHTIKGLASLIGLTKTVSLTHEWGTLIKDIRSTSTVVMEKVLEVFLTARDALRSLMNNLKEKGEEITDMGECLPKIKEAAKSLQAAAKKESPPQRVIHEKYLEVYLDDTAQNIESFNQNLVNLEKEPANAEVINTLFRIMHTIKGSSGMVNIREIQELAHGMESILAMVRERKEAFPDMFSLLFQGIDLISNLMISLRQSKTITEDVSPFMRELTDYIRRIRSGAKETARAQRPPAAGSVVSQNELLELAARSEGQRKLLTQALADKQNIFRIMVSIEEDVSMKTMKALLIEEHLKAKGTVILMDPSAQAIDDSQKGPLRVGVLFASAIGEKDIRSLLGFSGIVVLSIELLDSKKTDAALKKQEPQGQKKTADGSAPQASIRIDASKLDTLMNLSGELVTVRSQFERLVNLLNEEIDLQWDLTRTIDQLKSEYAQLSKEIKILSLQREGEYDLKKSFSRLERLHHQIVALETYWNKSQLMTRIHAMEETTGMLGKIASDIQAGVMQARMVPIKGVFSRFHRIVRDVAHEIGKDINLIIEGEETELDKNLVDSLADPLTHMVRNAMDHGIEDPKTRKKMGKPEKGTVILRASHRGNNVCIEVIDDGKGLDPEGLVQHALKKKLITPEQAGRLTDRGKLDLLFLPGFSTAEKVTGLSGRGVGMDVVRNMILSVSGAIDIESGIGKGSNFILKIPLTLAIIHALLVVVDTEIYAVPLDSVTEIVKIPADMIYSIAGNETIKLRDHVLSLIEMEKVIHLKRRMPLQRGFRKVVVISDGTSEVGIIVDDLIGESEIVIKSLSHHFYNVKGISGVTILGDGQIALILDPKLVIIECR